MKEYETKDKTVYEAVKQLLQYLDVYKKMSEDNFKRLAGKYAGYLLEEGRNS